MEPHHPADRLEQPELELDPEPVAPAPSRTSSSLGVAVGPEHDAPTRPIDPDRDIDAQVAAALGLRGPIRWVAKTPRLARLEPDDVLALARLAAASVV